MKTRKQFLSLLLAVCLIIGLLPTTAFAVETDTGKAIQLVDNGAAANISGGQVDNIYFGTYLQSSAGNGGYNTDPIKWRVLDNADGKLFLLSDQNLDYQSYNLDYISITWERSSIRSWLNGYAASENDVGLDFNAFFNFVSSAFSEDEQKAIADTYVYNATQSDGTSNPNPNYDTPGGNNTTDKIFLLSIEEVTNTAYGFSGDNTRVSTNTDYVARLHGAAGEGDNWWLRSPGIIDTAAAHVISAGQLSVAGHDIGNDVAVRPAFNLNLESVLFTSAAEGGKSLGTMGTLSAVPEYTGNEWKLTLLDENRSFKANVNGQASAFASAGGSVQISYSGAQTGDNEYVSVLLCDSSDTVLYYGNIAQNSANGTATLNIPSGLAAGNYTLKVFSEQCNGDYKTDYASAFQDISLTVTLPQETTPQASFTAKSDNGGILSNVDTSMKYSTDGGVNWNDVTGTSMELTGVTAANDVLVKKPGNGSTTSDSAVQTIDITQATKPTVSGADCTTSEQNDGKITGVDSTMEYKLSTASGWTDITGTEVTKLSNGTYDVRVKASGTALASAAATVTIGAHTCVAQGAWQYDDDEHWKLCACGAEVGRAAHSGGTATCTAQAVCTECSQSYGSVNDSNHTGTVVWSQTATTHKQVYNCCQTEVSAEENHKWENGECTVCYYLCEHDGGTATCSQLAVCDLCGSEYGDYDVDNHKAVSAWTQENGKHYHKCEYGCDTHLDEADCSGGTATCTSPAVCETCGSEYGDYDADNHKAVSAWTQENGKHYHKCEYGCDTHLDEADCFGGTATCTSSAVCETCGNAYGSVNPDNHTGTVVWTKTETTHSSKYSCCDTPVVIEEAHDWVNGVCSECGYECQHDGGTATCSQLAVCDICGEEYGDYDADNHKAVSAWTQENGKHYHKCEYGCDTHLDEADCSGGEATCTSPAVCETCGNSYGSVNPDNHTGEVVWTKTETTHSSKYSCCDTPVVTEEAHDWTNGVCSECGYECQHGGGTATCSQLAVCDICGSEYGDYDADNHKAVSAWTQENGKHYHKCEYGCDTHLDEADCSGGEATCTSLAVCDICGEEYGEINAANHTNLVKTEAKPATHTETGNIEYWYCDGCNKYFSDEAGTKEIVLENTVIPMIGHSADGTGWHSDETSHWNTCKCGEKLNEAAHTFEWVTDKEATATEAGLRHEECTVCGYEKAAVEIPATGTTEEPSEPSQPGETPSEPPKDTPDTDTTSPQTGDDSNIVLWIALMLAAGAALTGTAVYSRRRKYGR